MSSPPEFWNIWTSILSLTILVYLLLIHEPSPDHMSICVFAACIICQLCSTIYHIFCSIYPILYNLDLAGICCMSIGSPYIYGLAYGSDGLETYAIVMVLFTGFCIALIAKDTFNNEVSTCEACIILLSVMGNYPAIKLPAAQAAVVIVSAAYVLFKCLHFPESMLSQSAVGKIWHSHVLWHCAVLASQLCYVSLVWSG